MNEEKNQYSGNVDRFIDGVIDGWAISNLRPHSPAFVDIYINEKKIITIECKLSRKDVLEAGFIREFTGFRYDIAPILQFYSEAILSIKYSDTNLELPGSPLKSTCLGNRLSLTSTATILEKSHPITDGLFYGVAAPHKISKAKLLQDFRHHAEAGGSLLVSPPLVDWNIPLFQRPQHMAKWLAKCGVKVLYASVGWKYDNADGFYQLDENLYWTNQLPSILGDMPSSWITVYSTNFNYSIDDIVKWKESGHKILYEYIDHIDPKISGGGAKNLAALFDAINQESVDLFLASANVLREELLQRFPEEKIAFVQNGVDVDFYFKFTKRDPCKVQDNYKEVVKRSLSGRKVVGYFGAIAPWLDYELIEYLARNNPSLDFVFIGPPYDIKHDLPVADNVFWIGQVDYPKLPDHAIWFDVCFIPFEAGQIAKTTSPLKLYEYFALGKPVVVTSAMLECTQYEFVGRGFTGAEVSAAISEALKKIEDKKYIKFIKEQAVLNSWESRSKVLLHAMLKADTESPAQRNSVGIANVLSVIAFSTTRPERIVGANISFNLKRNAIEATFSNEDWFNGDLLSIVLDPTLSSETPIVETSFRIGISKNEAPRGFCVIDYLLSGVVIKTVDSKELSIVDIVSISHKVGQKIEVRMRVMKDIPKSWLPVSSYRLFISDLGQELRENIPLPQLKCSNPLGVRNPTFN